jgi:glutamate-ammonia-ligase adenylyltransferase
VAGGGSAPHATLEALRLAWELQQDLSQLLKVAIDDDADPTVEPAALRSLLTKTGDARGFADLKATLVRARRAAHGAFRAVVLASGDGDEPLVR